MENQEVMNNNNLTVFLLLAVMLLGFIAIIMLFSYIWALLFCAVGGGLVLWWSRSKRTEE